MRTVINRAAFNEHTGKWSVSFITWMGNPGYEYVAGETCSASVFELEAEALAAGGRALAMLESTGKYPNMCEAF
jgi:hypothetical protein